MDKNKNKEFLALLASAEHEQPSAEQVVRIARLNAMFEETEFTIPELRAIFVRVFSISSERIQ
jgi:hypothetical protein